MPLASWSARSPPVSLYVRSPPASYRCDRRCTSSMQALAVLEGRLVSGNEVQNFK
ncbi:MAG: hypothetical protein ACFE0I_03125 [Elainellaceae cyanobacterium]